MFLVLELTHPGSTMDSGNLGISVAQPTFIPEGSKEWGEENNESWECEWQSWDSYTFSHSDKNTYFLWNVPGPLQIL